MCIGLRAFLVIADGRQQSEGEPPMPQTMGVLPSGSTLRFKKTFINKFLTDQTARNIGLSGYYAHVRKAFDSMLRTLDAQVGRPMLLIRTENLNRAADDIITSVALYPSFIHFSENLYSALQETTQRRSQPSHD